MSSSTESGLGDLATQLDKAAKAAQSDDKLQQQLYGLLKQNIAKVEKPSDTIWHLLLDVSHHCPWDACSIASSDF